MRWIWLGFLLANGFGLAGLVFATLRGVLLLSIDPGFRWGRFFFWLFLAMTTAWAALCWSGLGGIHTFGTALFVFAPMASVLLLGAWFASGLRVQVTASPRAHNEA